MSFFYFTCRIRTINYKNTYTYIQCIFDLINYVVFCNESKQRKFYLLINKIFFKCIRAYIPNLIPCKLKFKKN